MIINKRQSFNGGWEIALPSDLTTQKGRDEVLRSYHELRDHLRLVHMRDKKDDFIRYQTWKNGQNKKEIMLKLNRVRNVSDAYQSLMAEKTGTGETVEDPRLLKADNEIRVVLNKKRQFFINFARGLEKDNLSKAKLHDILEEEDQERDNLGDNRHIEKQGGKRQEPGRLRKQGKSAGKARGGSTEGQLAREDPYEKKERERKIKGDGTELMQRAGKPSSLGGILRAERNQMRLDDSSAQKVQIAINQFMNKLKKHEKRRQSLMVGLTEASKMSKSDSIKASKKVSNPEAWLEEFKGIMNLDPESEKQKEKQQRAILSQLQDQQGPKFHRLFLDVNSPAHRNIEALHQSLQANAVEASQKLNYQSLENSSENLSKSLNGSFEKIPNDWKAIHSSFMKPLRKTSISVENKKEVRFAWMPEDVKPALAMPIAIELDKNKISKVKKVEAFQNFPFYKKPRKFKRSKVKNELIDNEELSANWKLAKQTDKILRNADNYKQVKSDLLVTMKKKYTYIKKQLSSYDQREAGSNSKLEIKLPDMKRRKASYPHIDVLIKNKIASCKLLLKEPSKNFHKLPSQYSAPFIGLDCSPPEFSRSLSHHGGLRHFTHDGEATTAFKVVLNSNLKRARSLNNQSLKIIRGYNKVNKKWDKLYKEIDEGISHPDL